MIQKKLISEHFDLTTSLVRWKMDQASLPKKNPLSVKSYFPPFRPSFYTTLDIRKLFISLNDRIPSNEKKGASKIECKDCDVLARDPLFFPIDLQGESKTSVRRVLRPPPWNLEEFWAFSYIPL